MSDLNERPSGDMKKKTGLYVAVLLMITAAAVIAGIIIYVVPAVKTAGRKLTVIGDEIAGRDINIEVGEAADEDTESDGTADEDTKSDGTADSWALTEGEQVSRVKIEAELINLYLVTGDAFHAEWSNAENTSYVNFDVTDGELRIREKGKTGFRISLSPEELGMNLTVPELKLTVPDSVSLEDLEIYVDCGNVAVNGISSKKTTVDAACGNIELKKAFPGDLGVQADCGNVDLDQVTADDTLLEADFGRVEILESSFRTLTANADCGVIECRRISAERVDLDADCGNIEISGDYGSLKADCDLGNIEVETDRPEDEVRLDLDAEVGNVTVNGKKQ